MTTDTSFRSVCEAFQATAAAGGDAIAVRSSDGAVELTWREFAARVERLAAGLATLGVQRDDTVGLLMGNRPEFHVVDTAVIHLGATPFSIYSTFPADQIAHLLANADCRVVIAEGFYLERLEAATAGLDQPVTLVDLDTIGEIEAAGAADFDFDFEALWRAVGPEDLLTLIYTSGTTGAPKGVEITHANMLAQVEMVASVLSIEPGDTITSYLPSAHIADRWSTHYNCLVRGVQVTDIADSTQVAAVLPELRPTLWGGVPRVFEKLVAGLRAALGNDPDEARRTAVLRAIEVGTEAVRARQEGRALDDDLAAEHQQAEARILAALRQRLGLDGAKWVICGAAPLARSVHEFLLALGLPMIELYGMSEMSCCVSVSPPEQVVLGAVGELLPGIESRIAEDGELLLRGPTVMAGYHHEPDKTADAIDGDGWMHTGDVAVFGPPPDSGLPDHHQVRIVDRKKELIINAAGKNMSPANIELELKAASPLIGQAVAIGDGRRFNTALLVLDPDLAAAHAKEHGLDDSSVGAVATDPAVRQLIADAVERANARLARVEQIKRWALLDEEWLPGGDVLTPTMKIKRRVIDAKYGEVIEGLYRD